MIPQSVLDAYVRRYPHLRHLARNAAAGMPAAKVAFAQNACRLSAPTDVSPRDIYHLAGVAEGIEWPETKPA
jgi:hypothetical protein